jgi:hypothetical protein
MTHPLKKGTARLVRIVPLFILAKPKGPATPWHRTHPGGALALSTISAEPNGSAFFVFSQERYQVRFCAILGVCGILACVNCYGLLVVGSWSQRSLRRALARNRSSQSRGKWVGRRPAKRRLDAFSFAGLCGKARKRPTVCGVILPFSLRISLRSDFIPS